MADSSDNREPLVRLAIAILDDPHGISEEAFELLKPLCKLYERAQLDRIISQVKKCDGRVYLSEDWDE